MDYSSFIFEKRKDNLLKISNGIINKEILYYINEARTSPAEFSREIMINDDVDESEKSLSLFFKYSSKTAPPLIFDKNIQYCCNKLFNKLISLDNGINFIKLSPYEKEKNSLKIRLNSLGLTPTYFKELIVIGIDDAMEAIISLLLNHKHRRTLLNPRIKYIGIASCLLPSEKICIIIGLVEDLIIIGDIDDEEEEDNNYDRCYYFDNVDDLNNFDYAYRGSVQPNIRNNNIRVVNGYYQNLNQNNNKYFNDFHWCNKNDQSYYNDRVKHYYPKKQVIFCNKNNYEQEKSRQKRNKRFIDLNISKEYSTSPIRNSYIGNRYRFTDVSNSSFAYYPRPVSVSYEKKYVRDRFGKIFPIYAKETRYDDGSILIQNPDEL